MLKWIYTYDKLCLHPAGVQLFHSLAAYPCTHCATSRWQCEFMNRCVYYTPYLYTWFCGILTSCNINWLTTIYVYTQVQTNTFCGAVLFLWLCTIIKRVCLLTIQLLLAFHVNCPRYQYLREADKKTESYIQTEKENRVWIHWHLHRWRIMFMLWTLAGFL